MLGIIHRFVADQRGASAVEYSLIGALVSVAAIVALQTLGSTLADLFSTLSDTLLDAGARAGL